MYATIREEHEIMMDIQLLLPVLALTEGLSRNHADSEIRKLIQAMCLSYKSMYPMAHTFERITMTPIDMIWEAEVPNSSEFRRDLRRITYVQRLLCLDAPSHMEQLGLLSFLSITCFPGFTFADLSQTWSREGSKSAEGTNR